MRLLDLDPEWITPDMFIFRNPTGGNDWLTCKRVPMTHWEQYEAVYGPADEESNHHSKWVGKSFVPTTPSLAWNFEGNDFATLTVHPSLDASKSGNWHGFIVNGNIVGGI